jgi:hypothetical protein
MKKTFLPVFCFLAFSFLSLHLTAQNELYNDGANIIVQSGALVFVQGSITNDDEGANIGRIGNSGEIQLEGNWTNTSSSNVFTALDPGTTTFLGNNPLQTINGTTDTYFNNLSINKPGVTELRLTRDALCDGVLNLTNDFLNTDVNTFGVANTATNAIQRTGPINPDYTQDMTLGYVTSAFGGSLSRATLPGNTYLFPVAETGRFRPVEITPVGGALNSYSVRFVNGTTPNYQAVIGTLFEVNSLYYHKIGRSLVSGANETIRVYYDFDNDNICDITGATLAEWNGILWDDLSPSSAVQNASPVLSHTTKTGYPGTYPTPFVSEDFAIAGVLGTNTLCPPLEVDLVFLKARPGDSYIQLTWETASERDNKGFFLERSTDGFQFTSITWVDGMGTTTQPSQYAFDDMDVRFNQRYYYRLRQIDLDGSELYSNMVEITLTGDGSLQIGEWYPNPSSGLVSIQLTVPANTPFSTEILNALGQVVYKDTRMLESGTQRVDIDLTGLASGTYFARFRTPDQTKEISRKLIRE